MGTMRILRLTGILVVLWLQAGCAMRVSGMVVDAETHVPIAGAMISANDKRERVRRSTQTGEYAIKTDGDTVSMTVSAPGYRTATVAIPTGSRHPRVEVELVPVESARKPAPVMVPVGVVPMTTRSTAEELQEVESLYDRGLISADEYKRMRARIVDGP